MGSPGRSSLAVDMARPEWREGRRRRGSNRRVAVQRKPALVRIAEALVACGRVLFALLRRLTLLGAVLALVAAVVLGGRWLIGYMVSSSHFAVRAVQLNPTRHARPAEVLALAGVREGDPLLAVDPDALAARIAQHPWAREVKVARKLPGTLSVEIEERQVAAVASMGGLYLVDDSGLPFKRAEMDEAHDLVILTGIDRGQFLREPALAQAAFREALALLRVYRGASHRPPLSEIHIDPRHGFSLFLREGGGELRLGHGVYGEKLARFDQILEALKKAGPRALHALRVVHLDGDTSRRVSMRLGTAPSRQ